MVWADAGAAVEVIGVLRYEEPELAEPLELNEGKVGGVGLDLAQRDTPPWRGKSRVAPCPHAVGAAEVGDTGIGADTCAREGDDVLAFDDPPGDRPDVFVEAIHVSFLIAYSGAFDTLSSKTLYSRSLNSENRSSIHPSAEMTNSAKVRRVRVVKPYLRVDLGDEERRSASGEVRDVVGCRLTFRRG
jgi:hypothetical protein